MKLLAILLACVALSGCTVIWTDHAFIYTFAKTVEAKDLGLIADPNSTRIGSGETRTKNDKVKASALIGGVPVTVGTNQ